MVICCNSYQCQCYNITLQDEHKIPLEDLCQRLKTNITEVSLFILVMHYGTVIKFVFTSCVVKLSTMQTHITISKIYKTLRSIGMCYRHKTLCMIVLIMRLNRLQINKCLLPNHIIQEVPMISLDSSGSA